MSKLQEIWMEIYRQYVKAHHDPMNPERGPSPIVLNRAKEHADSVIESLLKLEEA